MENKSLRSCDTEANAESPQSVDSTALADSGHACDEVCTLAGDAAAVQALMQIMQQPQSASTGRSNPPEQYPNTESTRAQPSMEIPIHASMPHEHEGYRFPLNPSVNAAFTGIPSNDACFPHNWSLGMPWQQPNTAVNFGMSSAPRMGMGHPWPPPGAQHDMRVPFTTMPMYNTAVGLSPFPHGSHPWPATGWPSAWTATAESTSERADWHLNGLQPLPNMAPASGNDSLSREYNGYATIQQKEPCPPRKALSAYNIFFREERKKLQAGSNDEDGEDEDTRSEIKAKRRKQKGSVGFETMAKVIATRWKKLDDDSREMKICQELAAQERQRYQAEKAEWEKHKEKELTATFEKLKSSVGEQAEKEYHAREGSSKRKRKKSKAPSNVCG